MPRELSANLSPHVHCRCQGREDFWFSLVFIRGDRGCRRCIRARKHRGGFSFRSVVNGGVLKPLGYCSDRRSDKYLGKWMAGGENGLGVYLLLHLFRDNLGEVSLEPDQSFAVDFRGMGLTAGLPAEWNEMWKKEKRITRLRFLLAPKMSTSK